MVSIGPRHSAGRGLVRQLLEMLQSLEIGMAVEPADWDARAKKLIKAELKRRDVTDAQLVEKLAAIGITETEPNIRAKIAGGEFTAVFFLQVMEAIGASSVRFDYGDVTGLDADPS